MNRNDSAKPETVACLKESPQPVRRSFVILVGLIVLAISGVLLFVWGRQSGVGTVQATQADETVQLGAKQPAVNQIVAGNAKSERRVFQFERSAGIVGTDPALELVKKLAEISAEPGGFTAEKAETWKRTLEQLIEQGKAAVPVIDQFLQSNGDFRFDSVAGGDLVGEPTLRIAFLKVLFDVPTPDNVELQQRILQTTTDPDEIALLARQLELQEPGEYREAIVQAAGAALAQSRQIPGRDASPLVKLLADYGVKAGN